MQTPRIGDGYYMLKLKWYCYWMVNIVIVFDLDLYFALKSLLNSNSVLNLTKLQVSITKMSQNEI